MENQPKDTSPTDAPEIGVGMLGYAFMGKAHSNAYRKMPYIVYPPPARPRLVGICGRDEARVAEAAQRYGYASHYTDWRRMIEDDRIQLFDNGGPNDLHREPTVLAAEAGKHVLCEKPLARTAREAWTMLEAVRRAGVKHMVAFNYRFVPAVRYMRALIEEGRLGRIYHFRARYLQDWLLPHHRTPYTWKLDREASGSGAGGDLGTHIIDLAHYLVGDVAHVQATTRTFTETRPVPDGTRTERVEVDDAFVATVAFENGAIGTLESSRMAAGRRNHQVVEVNGEKGSLRFALERLNELEVYWVDDVPAGTRGFHRVLMTEADHPWIRHWWPPGHIIGWEHTFVHEVAHLLDCIVNDRDVGPHGATFEDGFRANVVLDALLASAERRQAVDCDYQGVGR